MFTRAVLFDLDGTLYTMRALKARLTAGQWRDLDLLRRLASSRRALRGQTFADEAACHEALFRELAGRSGRSEEEASRWYRERFIPCFIGQLNKHADPRPGLAPMLERLRAQGTGLAIVSDYGWVAERLDALEISPGLFDLLLSSGAAGALKPSPAAINLVRQRWALPREAVLMVGDRMDRDGESARAAGIEYLQVQTGLATWSRDQGQTSWGSACQAIERFSSGASRGGPNPGSGDEE